MPPALLAGKYVASATYKDDTNFGKAGPSTIVTQSVGRFQTMGSVSSSSSQNTSLFGQASVTFTAKLTGAGGGYAPPTGSIAFAGTGISGCSSQSVDMNTGTATCSTNPSQPGFIDVVATYSSDNNYAVVAPTVRQTVEYFQLSPSAGFTTVIQTFDNTNTPYTSKTLTITAMPSPTPAYNGNLTMSCAIAPMVPNGPTCSVTTTMIPGASGPDEYGVHDLKHNADWQLRSHHHRAGYSKWRYAE